MDVLRLHQIEGEPIIERRIFRHLTPVERSIFPFVVRPPNEQKESGDERGDEPEEEQFADVGVRDVLPLSLASS